MVPNCQKQITDEMIKITITGTGIIGKTSTGISVWWIRKILPDPDPNFIPRIRI